MKIRSGERTQIRRETEKKILDISTNDHAPHALIPAAKTWEQIKWLLANGFSKAEINNQMGLKGRGLQIRQDQCTKLNADRIRKIYEEAGGSTENKDV